MINYFNKNNHAQIELIRVSSAGRRIMNITSDILKILQYNTYKRTNAVLTSLLQNPKI